MKSSATLAVVGALAMLVSATTLHAQSNRESRQGLHFPVYRVAQRPAAPARPNANVPSRTLPVRPVAAQAEHPLKPMISKAEELLAKMDKDVEDYSATLVKRERINGVLHDYQYMQTKVRHEQKNARGEVTAPFSVYLNFLAPEDIKGREVIYVEGHNGGKLTAHEGGSGLIAAIKSAVTVNLDPTSDRAMKGNKYPITDIGVQNLLNKLIEVATEDLKYDEVEVKVFENTKINGRVCTCLQSVHPQPRDHFRFHIARIYIDDELQIPIRYESYGWPKGDGDPPLLEEYTYLNLKLNNGFTDRDFDKSNPNYNFN